MTSPRRWPKLREEDQWLIELMEELLADPRQSSDQLMARARELRAEAEHDDVYRETTLVLADRYELAARARLAAS
jgi:hypothetical protein